MTQDEIMELVRQAGGTFGSHIAWVERDLMPVYIRFAHLVAGKEREACAVDANWCIQNHIEQHIPERIRARGQP